MSESATNSRTGKKRGPYKKEGPLSILGSCSVFHSFIESCYFTNLVTTEPVGVQTVVRIPTLEVIGDVGDRVERLPPGAGSVLRTGLFLEKRIGGLSIPRQIVDLFDFFLGSRVGEHFVVVGQKRLHRELLASEEFRHFFVLGELHVGQTHGFLHLIRIELRVVTDFVVVHRFTIQRHGQRVVANHSDRGEANVDRFAVLMGIGEEEIRIDLITAEDVERFFDLGERPDHLSALERTGGVHLHIAGEHEFGEELESIGVLNGIPVFTDSGEHFGIRHTNQGFLIRLDTLPTNFGEERVLLDFPVEPGFFEHLGGGQIVGDLDTQAVPRNFSSVSKTCFSVNNFYFMCHSSSPSYGEFSLSISMINHCEGNVHMKYALIEKFLIERGKGRTKQRRDGLHAHRILPGHEGGTYSSDNIAYLTRQEHRIVHKIRYRLYGFKGDKIAAAWLSGKLSDDEVEKLKLEGAKRGGQIAAAKHKQLKIGLFGLTSERKSEIGKIGGNDPKSGFHNPEVQQRNSRKGNSALAEKRKADPEWWNSVKAKQSEAMIGRQPSNKSDFYCIGCHQKVQPSRILRSHKSCFAKFKSLTG